MVSLHILGDRSRRNLEPKPRQLRLDPSLAPSSVLGGHAPDQGPQLRSNRAAPEVAFAT